MEKINLCYYGCGQEAKFIITKKNINCCSKNHSSCPVNRKKCSEGLKKEHKQNPKNYSSRKYFAQTVSVLKEKYPDWYNTKIEKQKKTWRERYENGLIKAKGTPHTEESKAKIREKRIAYLQKKNGETAWEKRTSRIPSYLENWFHENIIIKYQLTSKYDIISEYCEYPYFIDYAFINEKIAVELDGAVHFTNGDERIEHDLKRDRYLKEKGWIIYRIPYFEIQTNYQLVIETFLKFLNCLEHQEKSFENNLIKYKEYKITQKLKIKKTKILINNRKQKTINANELNNIEKIINATDINFSKFGWVEKVSKLINKKPQKINEWMKKYLPDFYKEKCFKRKNFKNK